jgi:hypothetical protein
MIARLLPKYLIALMSPLLMWNWAYGDSASSPLRVTLAQTLPASTVGGVGQTLAVINVSADAYHQLEVVFIPYDRYGRRQTSDIDDVGEVQIPLNTHLFPEQEVINTWPDVWFNHSIVCVEIDRLRITYSDGSRRVYRKDAVDDMLADQVLNDCQR